MEVRNDSRTCKILVILAILIGLTITCILAFKPQKKDPYYYLRDIKETAGDASFPDPVRLVSILSQNDPLAAFRNLGYPDLEKPLLCPVLSSLDALLRQLETEGRYEIIRVKKETPAIRKYKALKRGPNIAVALDMIPLEPPTIRQVLCQTATMQYLPHMNMLDFHSVHRTNFDGLLHEIIVTEWIDDTLEAVILRESRWKRSEYEIACIALQILLGIDYMHKNGVVHRNIRPSSIFIKSDGVVKIGGFESSFILSSHHEQIKFTLDSSVFSDPDAIEKGIYGKEVDIYSFGMTILFLSVFDDSVLLGEEDVKASFIEKILEHRSSALYSFLQLSLNKKQTAHELISHPFIQKSISHRALALILSLKRDSPNKKIL